MLTDYQISFLKASRTNLVREAAFELERLRALLRAMGEECKTQESLSKAPETRPAPE